MALRESGRHPPRTGLVPLRVRRPFRADIWLREPGSDFHTFREVVYEQIYTQVVERAVGCEYVLDLGGNIGLTSLHVAAAFPACRIMVVEPSPANLPLLDRNLAKLMATGRCQICPAAVWWEDTTVDLSDPPEGTGFDAVRVTGQATPSGRATPAFSIPTLMAKAGFPRVDLLKIDIEGAEAVLFDRAAGWLDRVNAIAIEFHADSRRVSGFDRVMKAAGFVVEEDRSPNTVVAFRPPGQRVR